MPDGFNPSCHKKILPRIFRCALLGTCHRLGTFCTLFAALSALPCGSAFDHHELSSSSPIYQRDQVFPLDCTSAGCLTLICVYYCMAWHQCLSFQGSIQEGMPPMLRLPLVGFWLCHRVVLSFHSMISAANI